MFEHKNGQEAQDTAASCEPTLSRKEFVALVLKRAAIAGAVIAAPKVVDKFMVQPANAFAVTSTRGHTEA
jgi:hypothetical protein